MPASRGPSAGGADGVAHRVHEPLGRVGIDRAVGAEQEPAPAPLVQRAAPARAPRPLLSPSPRRARPPSSSAVIDAISGLAGSPPTTALPVRTCTVSRLGLPGTVAQEKAVAG